MLETVCGMKRAAVSYRTDVQLWYFACKYDCITVSKCLTIYSWWSLVHQRFQFDFAQSHSVVTSNVELVGDRYVCDDVGHIC